MHLALSGIDMKTAHKHKSTAQWRSLSIKHHFKSMYSAKRNGELLLIYHSVEIMIRDWGYKEAYRLAQIVEGVTKEKRKLTMNHSLNVRLRLYKHRKAHPLRIDMDTGYSIAFIK